MDPMPNQWCRKEITAGGGGGGALYGAVPGGGGGGGAGGGHPSRPARGYGGAL